MNIKIKIPHLQGIWEAPASKSELIRYIAIAMQCEEESEITHVSWCNDSYTMLKIAEDWGADIFLSEEKIQIRGRKEPQSQLFNAGESALCLRLLIPILAKYNGTFKIEAEGSLLHRPIGEIISVLQEMGANITTQNQFPPITIKGPIKGKHISIEHPITSQNISGLLFTLPLLKENSQIKLNKLISLPYIKLTLSCLKQAGITIETNQQLSFYSINGKQLFKPINISTEGDWSSAALFFAAGAVSGNIEIKNLNPQSFQADKAILHHIAYQYKNRYFVNRQKINGIEADITHCPDVFPALMILCLHASSTSTITGTNRLIYKESNRLDKFIEEFSKFGAKFSLDGDSLHIRPPENILSATIDSHNDHRIAMAAALATVGSTAQVLITNAESVNKSYPSFWEDLKCLGAKIEIIEK
ncbi:MAG: 3-phosphoshikimate 1-carboxyvinyltransferase [Bacteroidales bacterium]|nr:3-phosphoshikimate 1-carboxyvinyltransferase [Bacteroidales bacterium]